MNISKQILKITVGMFFLAFTTQTSFAQSKVKIMDLYVHPYMPVEMDSLIPPSPFSREVGFKINSPIEASQVIFQFSALDSTSNSSTEIAQIVKEGADYFVQHPTWGKQKIYKYNVDLVIQMGSNIPNPGILTLKIKDKGNNYSNILTTKIR